MLKYKKTRYRLVEVRRGNNTTWKIYYLTFFKWHQLDSNGRHIDKSWYATIFNSSYASMPRTRKQCLLAKGYHEFDLKNKKIQKKEKISNKTTHIN